MGVQCLNTDNAWKKQKRRAQKKGRCPYLIDKKDCKVMLSNSDTKLARELYKGFRIETVFAKRAINCKPSGRGEISELVILNY